ncbi:unnamed protein product [Caenorhabditis sp. 36 PRJEB53466]|nr:unnamed protein product [Caenorhabditis sp. 36 PRJEB53466]
MTTNALSLGRFRSKSIADVFTATEIEDDKEDLLPRELPGTIRSTLEKWKSSLNLNIRKNTEQSVEQRRSRANSIFTRPPTHPHPRRQSLAEMFRKPSGIKDDIKKIWEKRPSLSLAGLKSSFKERKSGDGGRSQGQSQPRGQFEDLEVEVLDNEEEEGGAAPVPAFFIVDRSAWHWKS